MKNINSTVVHFHARLVCRCPYSVKAHTSTVHTKNIFDSFFTQYAKRH